jgi:hypothetical protein
MKFDPDGRHWVEGQDGNITWVENVTSDDDEDLPEGATYRGEVFHRFTAIEGNKKEVMFESYNSDKTSSSVKELRPDADGVVTHEEAQRWYAYSGGMALTIDLSKLDFKSSDLSVEADFNGNNSASVNFFNGWNTHMFSLKIIYRPAEDENLSHVLGTVRVVCVDKNLGTIRLATKENGSVDTYDFTTLGFIPKMNYPNGSYEPFDIFSNGNLGTIRIKDPKPKSNSSVLDSRLGNIRSNK